MIVPLKFSPASSQLEDLVQTSALRYWAERAGLTSLQARKALLAKDVRSLLKEHREFLARLEPRQRSELRRAVKWRRAFPESP